MSMKTLQNNFTTPEQSKSLLELGVPADSADCYIDPLIKDKKPWVYIRHDESFWIESEAIPCWSVGRLIEIYETCTSCFFGRRFMQYSALEDVLLQIETASKYEWWDFSNLED